MYLSFFGLREHPFDLTANPRFLFLSPAHKEALSNLQYAVSGGKGVAVLLGQAGTGKTTILRAFLAASPDPRTRLVLVENPALTREELYELLAIRLDLGAAAERSKARFLVALEASLAPRNGTQPRIVLLVDEAQAISAPLLEELRLLTNVETDTEKLLSVVLAGQPELGTLLETPAFEALKQRVTLRCELTPFHLSDTAAYIAQRLRIAGGDPAAIFSREAVAAIHDASGGVARSVSVICDNALVAGFAGHVKPVGPDIVEAVCRDFLLAGSDAACPAAASSAVTPDYEADAQGDQPDDLPARRRTFSRFFGWMPAKRRMTTLSDLREPPRPKPGH